MTLALLTHLGPAGGPLGVEYGSFAAKTASVPGFFEAIRARFKAQVSDPLELKTIHDNAPEPTAITSSWCRFSISPEIPGKQESTGGPGARRFRTTGTATVNIFVPIAKGDAAALAIADAIVRAFRGISIAPQISFINVGAVGAADQDAAWCRRRVVIPFRADEIE